MEDEQQRLSIQSVYFSHTTYEKLKNIDTKNSIILIETFIKSRHDMSDELIEFDTTYYNGGGIKHNYQLNGRTYIVLLFKDSKGQLFTTIRPHTAKKLSYYNAMRGREFFIEFKDFEQANYNTIERHIPRINRSFMLK